MFAWMSNRACSTRPQPPQPPLPGCPNTVPFALSFVGCMRTTESHLPVPMTLRGWLMQVTGGNRTRHVCSADTHYLVAVIPTWSKHGGTYNSKLGPYSSLVFSFIHSFINPCSVPGTVPDTIPGTKEVTVNKTKVPAFAVCTCRWRDGQQCES